MARTESPLCTILGYHEVDHLQPGVRRSLLVSPSTFATHLASLRLLGGTCVSLEDVAMALEGRRPLPRRAFAITFDDAYVGVHRYALPLLQRFGCTATVFVPSSLIGQQETPGETAPVAKMNADQLRDLGRQGITVGAHTRSHPDLTRVSGPELKTEIRLCRDDLEELLDRPIRTFSYPFGRYNRAAVEVVKEAGYAAACTTEYGRVQTADDPHTLPRVLVGENLAFPLFLYRLWRAKSSGHRGHGDEP